MIYLCAQEDTQKKQTAVFGEIIFLIARKKRSYARNVRTNKTNPLGTIKNAVSNPAATGKFWCGNFFGFACQLGRGLAVYILESGLQTYGVPRHFGEPETVEGV